MAPLKGPLFTAAEKDPASILEVEEGHCSRHYHSPSQGRTEEETYPGRQGYVWGSTESSGTTKNLS